MKHKWKLDENGIPDEWAFDSEFHNGVHCERCGKCVCVYCHPDWQEMDDCEEEEADPITNGDRLRAMTDEELAWEIMQFRFDAFGCAKENPACLPNTQKDICKWLQAPAGEATT